MHKVWILECAAEEAAEAAKWYESRQPGLGLKFHSAVRHAMNRMEEHAGFLFPILDANGDVLAHHMPLKTFPYSMITIEQDENSLVIIAVAHHSRRPGYWSPRVVVVKG